MLRVADSSHENGSENSGDDADQLFPVDLTCPSCNADLTDAPLYLKHRVCSSCRRHFWMPARERIALLVDDDSFIEPISDLFSLDPTLLHDRLPVADRLTEERELPAIGEAVVTGTAKVGGVAVVAVAVDLTYLGGGLGIVAAEHIASAMEIAATRRLPLILLTCGGGAQAPEGVLALAQLAKLSATSSRLRRAGVPFVAILTHPTAGTLLLGLGLQADVLFAEPGALIALRPNRGDTLNASEADTLLAAGYIDDVVDRAEQRDRLSLLLTLLAHRGVARPSIAQSVAASSRPWEALAVLRRQDRPSALHYLDEIVPRRLSLHGDREGGNDARVTIALGRVRETAVALLVVGDRAGGGDDVMLPALAYRKARRLLRIAGHFELPVVVLVDSIPVRSGSDTPGAAETAVAQYIGALAAIPSPVLVVLTGEVSDGPGFAWLIGDRLLMQAHAGITPHGSAGITTALECVRLGIADAVVPEPRAGAHLDPTGAAIAIGDSLVASLSELTSLGPRRLLDERARRMRTLGLGTDASREEARLEMRELQELQRRVRGSVDDLRVRFESRQIGLPHLPTMPNLSELASRGTLPQINLPRVALNKPGLGDLAGRVAATKRALSGRDLDPVVPSDDDA